MFLKAEPHIRTLAIAFKHIIYSPPQLLGLNAENILTEIMKKSCANVKRHIFLNKEITGCIG